MLVCRKLSNSGQTNIFQLSQSKKKRNCRKNFPGLELEGEMPKMWQGGVILTEGRRIMERRCQMRHHFRFAKTWAHHLWCLIIRDFRTRNKKFFKKRQVKGTVELRTTTFVVLWSNRPCAATDTLLIKMKISEISMKGLEKRWTSR